MGKNETNGIPRKSEFNLDEEERSNLLGDFEEWINGKRKDSVLFTNCSRRKSQEMVTWAIDNVYYAIGMLDYKAYCWANNPNFTALSKKFGNNPLEARKLMAKEYPQEIEEMKRYLATRAYYCGMLQAFEEDVTEKGYAVEPEFKHHEVIEKDLHVFHGTTANITEENLGKKTAAGTYAIRDGIVYFAVGSTIEEGRERASRFACRTPDNPDNGTVFERIINENDRCVYIPRTCCATCFMYQDELIALQGEGIKYVESNGPEFLNIESFTDFVNERDNGIKRYLDTLGIRLPQDKESYAEYFSALGIETKDIKPLSLTRIGSQKNVEYEPRYVKYDEMFKSEIEFQQTPSKNIIERAVATGLNNPYKGQSVGIDDIEQAKRDINIANHSYEIKSGDKGKSTSQEIE